MTATLEAVLDQVRAGKIEEAQAALGGCSENDENRAQLLFVRGLVLEMQHDMEGAAELYEQALEVDGEHTEALFRGGLMATMLGDDDLAIELLEQCVTKEQTHVNALINLAIIYEDHNQLEEAEACLMHVLAECPNHARAQQFLKSVESSYNMVYDERQAREREKRDAVLDTPISDFELSVRSRNCLKQMNICSLGDLLRTTEAELLSYKNFGETSLNEIKAMLSQKGLRLGQGLQLASPHPMMPAAAPEPSFGAASNIPVSSLELSVRSRKCLQRLGIGTLGELAQRSEAELSATRNFGDTSLNEIKRAMASFGITFRDSI